MNKGGTWTTESRNTGVAKTEQQFYVFNLLKAAYVLNLNLMLLRLVNSRSWLKYLWAQNIKFYGKSHYSQFDYLDCFWSQGIRVKTC